MPYRWLPLVALALTLFWYAALETYALLPVVHDEGIYHYLASRMAEGAIPYRDFFHAHPPLHLMPAALLYGSLGGYNVVAGKLIPILATALTGVLLYRAARRIGPLEAPLTSALYLLGPTVLTLAPVFVGSNLSAMWTALCLERLTASRYKQAGAAIAAATATLLSAAPVGIAISAVLLFADFRSATRFIGSGAITFLAINLLCVLFAGWSFVDQVYLFHLGKSAVAGESFAVFRAVINQEPWLFYGGAAGAIALIFLGGSLKKGSTAGNSEDATDRNVTTLYQRPTLLVVCAAGTVASLAFLGMIARPFTYYFQQTLLLLAPLAAFGLAEIGRRAVSAFRTRDPNRAVEALGLSVVLAAGVLSYWMDPIPHRTNGWRFEWRGSSVPVVDSLVRPLLWIDELEPGEHYAGWSLYLAHMSLAFDELGPISDEVRARTTPDDSLFGSSQALPLVALSANRRVSLDMADTNVMRFQGDAGSIGSLTGKLDDDPPAIILTRTRHGLITFDDYRAWLRRRYEPVYQLESPSSDSTYTLWAPKDMQMSTGAAQKDE